MIYFLFRFFSFPFICFCLLQFTYGNVKFEKACYIFFGTITTIILGLIFEMYARYKKKPFSKINIKITLITFYLFSILLFYFFVADQFMYSCSSVNGNYKVNVYTEQNFISMPGDGGLYSRTANIVLKNKWGFIIGSSGENCKAFYGDVKIEWDYSDNKVYFARGAAINLITGKSCE
jgi:hypothetical protein